MRVARLALPLATALVAGACMPSEPPLRIAASSSLRPLVEGLVELHAATASEVGVELHAVGSLPLADGLATGQVSADVVFLADESLFGLRLQPGWTESYVRFARDRLVLALAERALEGTDQEEPQAWERRLRDPGGAPVIADPSRHSSGYRALLALRLHDRLHPEAGLESLLLGRLAESPPAHDVAALVAELHAGRRGPAIVYGLTARAAGLATLPLPAEIDLGTPHLAATYSRASYEPYADAPLQPGAPIVFALGLASDPARPEAALQFLRTVLGESGRALATELGLEPVLGAERPVGFVLPETIESVLEATAR